MQTKKNTRVKQKPDIVFHVDGSETFILDEKNEVILGLNPVGSFIWKLMESWIPIHILISRVVEAFDVTESVARQDVEDFLQKLKDRKLIEA